VRKRAELLRVAIIVGEEDDAADAEGAEELLDLARQAGAVEGEHEELAEVPDEVRRGHASRGRPSGGALGQPTQPRGRRPRESGSRYPQRRSPAHSSRSVAPASEPKVWRGRSIICSQQERQPPPAATKAASTAHRQRSAGGWSRGWTKPASRSAGVGPPALDSTGVPPSSRQRSSAQRIRSPPPSAAQSLASQGSS